MQIPASVLDRLGELCLELRRLPRELLRHVGEPMAFPTTHRRFEVFGEGQGRILLAPFKVTDCDLEEEAESPLPMAHCDAGYRGGGHIL
jgi:hypothetical protein